ncbi:hypothetical protein Tco_0478642, partial [Tanacetum coccineum]
MTWIKNVVSQDVYMGLIYSENVVDVWKELNETYDKEFPFDKRSLPEVKEAYNVISKEESHRGILETSGVVKSKQNATSFADKTFNNNRIQMQTLLNMINDKPSGSIHANMAGHPNGTLAIISHVGNLKLSNNVIIYDVLVVPGYFVSLLSVNKLIRDSKMFVGFVENKCYIQDLEKEKIARTDVDTTSDVDHLEFFDSLFPQSLNDDRRDSSIVEAMSDPNWVEAMNNEIEGDIERYKAGLVAKDINSSFLYGDLHEDVYMTLPDGYNDENKSKVCVLKYFLGIEIVENDLGLCMSQRKYCLELLYEYGLLASRPADIPLPKNCILSFDETTNDKYLSDFTTYQKLV